MSRIETGAYGYDLGDDQSPLYVVVKIKNGKLGLGTRFDDPPCSLHWVDPGEFWCIA